MTGGNGVPSGGGGFMNMDRVLGLILVAFAIWLLVYGIPANVKFSGTQFPRPHLFPQIGAWVILLGGLGQLIGGKGGTRLPPMREMGRFALVSVLTVGMIYLMDGFGYIIGGMAFVAALMFVVFEKRPLWIVVAVFGVPAFSWVLFEKILERPLP